MNICFYCGEPADEQDHIVPQAHTPDAPTVDCCRECNGLLWKFLFSDLAARLEYLESVYRVRYSRVLWKPDWTHDELSTLGPGLQLRIKTVCGQRARAWARIDHIHRAAVRLRSYRTDGRLMRF